MRCATWATLLTGCLGFFLAGTTASAQNPVPAPRAPIFVNVPASRPTRPGFNNPVMPGFPTLAFDALSKQYNAKPGDKIAPFVFSLTNVWTNEIIINQVHASCGCTTAKLPDIPWHLLPGASGDVHAQINLAGKSGLVTKTLTFYTSVGNRIVTLKVQIPPPGGGTVGMSADERRAAMATAEGNPLAIFRGECATCHVNKGAGALGQDLYAVDCGICHESPNRASAVPDLHALKHPTDLDFWKTMITFGKPHSMMPGFARAQGGPLSDVQITSLATYLNRTISHNFMTAQMTNAAIAPQ